MIKEVGIQVLAIVQSIVGLEYLLSISSTGDFHEILRRQRSKRESILVSKRWPSRDRRYAIWGDEPLTCAFERGISIVVVILLILFSPFKPVYMFSSKCSHLPRAGSTLLAHYYHSSQVSFVWLRDHFYQTAGIVPLLTNPLAVFTDLLVQQSTASCRPLTMNATLYARLQHGVGHIWILLGQP